MAQRPYFHFDSLQPFASLSTMCWAMIAHVQWDCAGSTETYPQSRFRSTRKSKNMRRVFIKSNQNSNFQSTLSTRSSVSFLRLQPRACTSHFAVTTITLLLAMS